MPNGSTSSTRHLGWGPRWARRGCPRGCPRWRGTRIRQAASADRRPATAPEGLVSWPNFQGYTDHFGMTEPNGRPCSWGQDGCSGSSTLNRLTWGTSSQPYFSFPVGGAYRNERSATRSKSFRSFTLVSNLHRLRSMAIPSLDRRENPAELTVPDHTFLGIR